MVRMARRIGVLLTLVTAGLTRTLREALQQSDSLSQWTHVLRHEQRFIEALAKGCKKLSGLLGENDTADAVRTFA